ncbi:UPF0489 family protein [Bradyrhizobium sp. CCBAU 53338]|uniref:UPF0489 family protein n=1 Tax=Bradyrhizobium sp. CCBAU 53338 TaxID=1325111 RepID=UPI00188A7215|nr:UPF0489 family protein [Bradyrhizobium sp. CCBAU 53338]
MISMDEGKWLVPFKGRGSSAYTQLNFLWQHENVFVMDNHRAAMWCWLQRIKPTSSHSLFHIDQHYDTRTSHMNEWLKKVPSCWDIPIEDYLSLTVAHPAIGEIPLLSWDNYLSIYLELFGRHLNSVNFATHRVGERPKQEIWEHDVWDVPENLDYWLKPELAPWIMNVDLDYFFCDASDDQPPQRFLSPDFISGVFDVIARKRNDGTIGVVTIALTSTKDLTGGWGPAVETARLGLSRLGIDFALP